MARGLPDGTPATIEGVLTTDLGDLDAGRGGFIQDPSGGVALYLDAAAPGPLPAGSLVVASGTLGDRYGQRTLRTSLADLVVLGPAPLPDAVDLPTGDAGESIEGWRVRVAGMVVESPSALADGTGLTVDDGTGPVRVVVGAEALAGGSVMTGVHVEAVGPLGQRDSTGTGATGYRVMAMLAGDLVVAAPAPSPSPSAPPSAEPSATPAPTPEPSVSASPVPSPSPSPSVAPSPTPTPPVPAATIASARLQPAGSFIRVAGVVTAEAGALGKPPLLAIQDETAAIVVHLPDDVPGSPRGTHVLVAGKLASVYGQLEIRPDAASISIVGEEAPPEALAVRALDLGEGLEARLVAIVARVAAAPVRGTSGDLTVEVTDADGRPARVGVDGSRGIAREAFVRGRWYRFTGVEGQHASRLGALDGYRIWLRDAADLVAVAAPSSSATPAPTTGPTGSSASGGGAAAAGDGTDEPPSSEPAVLSIAAAIRLTDVDVAVEGVVTAGTQLLDASRRRLVLQDPTAAVEVLLAAPSTVRPGTRLRVLGSIGRAYGAPRLRADRVETLGIGEIPGPARLTAAPGESLEWRLVQVSGRVDRLTRTGTSWRADLVAAGRRLLVVGLTGAAIPPARLAAGDAVTVTGIVRRPYPSATDRRYAVVPRSLADVVVGRAASGPAATPVATSRGAAAEAGTATSSGDSGAELVDLARIREFVGRSVRVAGLVAALRGDELWLDDGTATAALVIGEQARAVVADLHAGDAVEALGVVAEGSDGTHLQVDDPAGIVLAGAVVAAASAASTPGSSPAPSPASDAAVLPGELDEPTPTMDLAGSVMPPSLAVLLALAVVAATLRLRRRGAERVAQAVLARRLASIPVSPAAPRVATAADEPGHVRPGTLRAG